MLYNKFGQYLKIVEDMFGPEWKILPIPDCDGPWGVFIMKAVADNFGNVPEPSIHYRHYARTTFQYQRTLAQCLDVDPNVIKKAFERLSMNGAFLRRNIIRDLKQLRTNDQITLSYYAAIASGFAGSVNCQ